MHRIDRFRKEAIEIASNSTETKKVGAVLTKGNNIIATAHNEAKTHPLQAEYAARVGQPERVFLHAELRAIIMAKDDADTIFVARVNRRGYLRNARPCPVCSAALYEFGVQHVYYTVTDGWVYANMETIKGD